MENSKSSAPGSSPTKQDDSSVNDKKKPTSPNTSVPSASDATIIVTPDKHKTVDASSTGTIKSGRGRKGDEPGAKEQLPKSNDAAPRKSPNQKKTNDTPRDACGRKEPSLAEPSSASVREKPQSCVTSSTRTERKEDKPGTENKSSSTPKEAASQRSHDHKKTIDPPQKFFGHGKPSSAQPSSASDHKKTIDPPQKFFGHGKPSSAQPSSASDPKTLQSCVSSTTCEHRRQNKFSPSNYGL